MGKENRPGPSSGRTLAPFRLLLAVAALAVLAPSGASAKALPEYQVAGLQVALYRFGHYKGPIDGIAGPMTNHAIVAFQKQRSSPPTAKRASRRGRARPLRPAPLRRAPSGGARSASTSRCCSSCCEARLPAEAAEQHFGPATEELVPKFQRKAGLPWTESSGRRHVPRSSPGRHQGDEGEAATKAKPHEAPRRAPGETLTAIAERNGTTVRELASSNKLDPSSVLLIGVKLLVPKRQTVARSTSVTASIHRWSAHYGVSPRLARALAWQESGFQPHVRSSVGATGVMQVIPATRDFVELFVIGRQSRERRTGASASASPISTTSWASSRQRPPRARGVLPGTGRGAGGRSLPGDPPLRRERPSPARPFRGRGFPTRHARCPHKGWVVQFPLEWVEVEMTQHCKRRGST